MFLHTSGRSAVHLALGKFARLVAVPFLITGCAPWLPKYEPHKNESYVIRGQNHTFAIYNTGHRLITHPIDDLFAQVKWRQLACKDPITDIYVVSHGWNYTLSEAIGNYHNYMEMLDYFMTKDGHNRKEFQPYFIFITWTSTTRPVTDLTKAMLPFGLDDAVKPLTLLIDKVPLHLTTAWKESLNATHNALGTSYPNDYLSQSWTNTEFRYDAWDGDSDMGEDIPVSALLYKLIQMKGSKATDQSACSNPSDISDPTSDKFISLSKQRIHLVGHSYGAKLVTLAGMEAIRRWLLVDKLHYVNKASEPLSDKSIDAQDAGLKNCYSAVEKRVKGDSAAERYNRALFYTTGHFHVLLDDVAGKIIGKRFGSSGWPPNMPCLTEVQKQASNFFPIDSLVMFNPAMHPGELSYSVSLETPPLVAPGGTLRFIPRKAIVYTRHDGANGALFNIREIALNTQASQFYHSLHESVAAKTGTLGEAISGGVLGPISLGYAVSYGAIGYGLNTLWNLPQDLVYHVKASTLDGLFDEAPKDTKHPAFALGKGAINFVDFFLPLKFTNWSDFPNSLLVTARDEREQGLYRLSRPALGKTGLTGLTAGRNPSFNLWSLEDFYTNDNVPDYGPDAYCEFSSKPNVGALDDDYKPDDLTKLREKIYSFDASHVYDSSLPPVGAHSDLRGGDQPGGCHASSPDKGPLAKRDYTFNFLFNFTKTKFEEFLEPNDIKAP